MTNEPQPFAQPPDPLEIEGRPLNVLIQLQGTAAAYVKTAEIKQSYDAIVTAPVPQAAPPPRPEPFGPPVSAGRRIVAEGHYVVDKEIKTRTL